MKYSHSLTDSDEITLSLHELTECINEITNPENRNLATVSEASNHVVRVLYDALGKGRSPEEQPALIRLFMTNSYGKLERPLREFVDQKFPELPVQPDTKCLTLMGTVGDRPKWCEVSQSEGHQAIPLPSAEGVKRIPMIARLVAQLGLEIEQVLEPSQAVATEFSALDFNVFHVEHAEGSPYIPAQESFVVPMGIRSVVGFGSMLPTGHLYSVILFSRLRISRETAELLRSLALGAGIAILPFLSETILAENPGPFAEIENVRAQLQARDQLLEVFRATVSAQSTKLSGTLAEIREKNSRLETTLRELHDARAKLLEIRTGLASHFAKEKLRERGTYKVAFVVGTFINIYGHVLVPHFRGNDIDLYGELVDSPVLTVTSVVIAYFFPIAVQVYAAVKSRMDTMILQADVDAAELNEEP